jgi:hypothetical protein
LEQIGKSLAQAAAREKQLQDDLAMAEEEGRERDAVRLRRQLADLAESSDELQKALDLIEARIEMERERAREREEEVEPRPSEEVSLLEEEGESVQASLEDEASLTDEASLGDEKGEEKNNRGDDLTARKSRLGAPRKK